MAIWLDGILSRMKRLQNDHFWKGFRIILKIIANLEQGANECKT